MMAKGVRYLATKVAALDEFVSGCGTDCGLDISAGSTTALSLDANLASSISCE